VHCHSDSCGHPGHIAETLNALADKPVFQGATINAPHEPLSPRGFKVGYDRMIFGGDLNEIVHVRYAPHGDIVHLVHSWRFNEARALHGGRDTMAPLGQSRRARQLWPPLRPTAEST
jgi:hypothetical protein